MMETFNLRIDKETRDKLDFIAKRHRRSRANIIRVLIEKEADNEKEN